MQVFSVNRVVLVAVVAMASLLICSAMPPASHAQQVPYRPDSATVSIEATGASQQRQPFWLVANRNGIVDDASANGIARLGLSRSATNDGSTWEVGYGVDAVTRLSQHETAHFAEIFAALRYRGFVLRAGRWAETVGATNPRVSSGSLTMSRNAIPVPRVTFSTVGYVDVPYSQGYAEVKGRWTHGWMTGDRYVDRPYLHAKHAFLRLGGDLPVRVFGGLVHNALWAGRSSDPSIGEIADGPDDFWRVITVQAGEEGQPLGEQIYKQGNHLGIIEIGGDARLGTFRIGAYRQFIYEDEDGAELETPQDGLLGITVADTRSHRIVQRLTYEYLYTKWQSGSRGLGPQPPAGEGVVGDNDYYNHYIYRSGWTSEGRTIGSPLLLTYPSAPGIESNRVIAHHVGISGHPVESTQYRLLATYARHYGNYSDLRGALLQGRDYDFVPPKHQYSVLLETTVAWPGVPGLSVRASAAYDAGSVFDSASFGGGVALQYDLRAGWK
jgi:hypothetical protein